MANSLINHANPNHLAYQAQNTQIHRSDESSNNSSLWQMAAYKIVTISAHGLTLRVSVTTIDALEHFETE